MARSLVRTFIVVALAIPALLLALPALAQYPPGEETDTTPEASFGCEGLTAGGTATCSIGGFESGSEVSVEVTVDETAVFADVLVAGENGFVSFAFDVPADAEAVGFGFAGTGLDGEPVTFTDVLAAAAPAGGDTDAAPDDGLPSTGEMVSLLLVAAVLALGVGTLAVRRGRSKADATTGS